MASKTRLIPAAAAALALAGLVLGCSGDFKRRDLTAPPATSGEATVSVTVPAGAEFFGFDLMLGFDGATIEPVMPVGDAAMASGIAAGATCEAQEVGATLRLSCISATGMQGPGEIALFELEWEDDEPDEGDFALTCDFVDEEGRDVVLGCDLDVTT